MGIKRFAALLCTGLVTAVVVTVMVYVVNNIVNKLAKTEDLWADDEVW